jgi:hypothetical protein
MPQCIPTQNNNFLKKELKNNSINKSANELNKPFSKENMQLVDKYMQKYSISLAIKEMQIKLH